MGQKFENPLAAAAEEEAEEEQGTAEEGAEPPGVAFWLPPLSPCPFAGARPDVDAVVGALKAGGLPATHDQKGPARAMLLSAILMPNLVALEAEGWSLSRFIAGEHRKRAKQAAEEALAIVAQETGVTAGAGMRWAGLDMLGLGLRVGRGIMPLPLEPYLAYHFTKVGDQTRAMIDAYIAHGAARGLKTEALEALTGLLG